MLPRGGLERPTPPQAPLLLLVLPLLGGGGSGGNAYGSWSGTRAKTGRMASDMAKFGGVLYSRVVALHAVQHQSIGKSDESSLSWNRGRGECRLLEANKRISSLATHEVT